MRDMTTTDAPVPWPGPVPAVRFRIVKPTDKWDEVLAFYTQGIGLQIQDEFHGHEGYDGVMIGLPDAAYHLEVIRFTGGLANPSPNQDAGYVFYFQDASAIASIAARLAAMGYPTEPAQNPYWNTHGASCIYDPDGWAVILAPMGPSARAGALPPAEPSDPEAASPDPQDAKATAAKELGVATRAVHAGESPASPAFPIFQGNTTDGRYIRAKNPTVEAVEEKIRSLEGAAMAVASASGMAAVSQTLLGILRAGDRMVVHEAVFVGVQTLLDDYLKNLGIEVVPVQLNDHDALVSSLAKPTRIVYFETVVNPTLEVIDAPRVIATARDRGAYVIVDNTVLTPCLFKPLAHGAHAVIHSATKYLSGHGDMLGGVVSFNDTELGERVHKARRIFGGMPSPLNAFLLMRGIKTLPVRMERHCRNARCIADMLARHQRIRKVWYPGMRATDDNRIASTFLRDFGGLISFAPAEPFDWDRFTRALQLCRPWMSFGDATTLVQFHHGRARLSVGLEDVEDIMCDLDRALHAAGAS